MNIYKDSKMNKKQFDAIENMQGVLQMFNEDLEKLSDYLNKRLYVWEDTVKAEAYWERSYLKFALWVFKEQNDGDWDEDSAITVDDTIEEVEAMIGAADKVIEQAKAA